MFVSNRRFADYQVAQGERDRVAEKAHDALREQITDLSEQARGEFERMRTEVERRHGENRKLLYGVAVAIIGAYAATYFAQHGLATPGFDKMRISTERTQ